MTPKTAPQDFAFITSFREFARDTSIRKRAIKERKPIFVEDRKAKEMFLLVPPEMYKKLAEKYQDWCDAEEVKSLMKESSDEDFTDWDTLTKEFSVTEDEIRYS